MREIIVGNSPPRLSMRNVMWYVPWEQFYNRTLVALLSNHGAFFALGTDEGAILELLTARSNTQRQEIKAVYKTLFGKVVLS